MAELTPLPFGSLVRRMCREFEREGKIFDLPAGRFWRGATGLDTSVAFHGRRAANPLGPAAGPHGQMAQNIVLAWLAGGRILELKTVQILDRLSVPRPCIDAQNICFNVEWSQELSLEQSLGEYLAASMLIDILKQDDRFAGAGVGSGGDTLFDMSIGYDLKGIGSPRLLGWIGSMKDSRRRIDRLRTEIPDEFRRLRDLDFSSSVSRQVTLSTFHGCPAAEVEEIARWLLTEQELDVTVKLNPTLLGRAQVEELLHDALGYTELETRPEDFERELGWEPTLEMTDRLGALARSLGRGFGVKLTNTLVVKNHRGVFPPSEAVHYLSGQPLHVLTITLLDRFRRARPELPIAFSAGVDRRNFPDCVALGLVPVTTCTDLLRPGGYGRLQRYLGHLEERMHALGVKTIGDFIVKAQGRGEEAIRAIPADAELRRTLSCSLASDGVDLMGVLELAGRADVYGELVREAARLNTPTVAARVLAEPRYRAAQNRTVPRKVGSRLKLFDCLNCDKCVPVCPNDANFAYQPGPCKSEYASYQVRAGVVVTAPGGDFEVEKAHQIANYQDFCNECGNCDTFCPEDGGPEMEKPRFFGSMEAWKRLNRRDGFFVIRQEEVDAVWARIGGIEYHLEVDRVRDRALFTDGWIRLESCHSQRRVRSASAGKEAPEGHHLDFGAYLTTAVVVDGVLDTQRANPVNAGYL